ncbi:undecaprenyl-phosphate galactose phosphotransferase WbaP [Celerinatantimonas yamalensis]|uniref:Undecaprenyl-phosphate galactose phosphotransferase WbaP n=1 Tax=Celerinatantimonas yamalensis TaxID=559956 RepID=A0ABW9G4A1_9GAMM
MGQLQVIDQPNWQQFQSYRATVNKLALIGSDLLAMFLAALLVYAVGGLRGTSVFPLAGGYGSAVGIARSFFLMGLALVGVLWFWGKLRHYTYRKPFWSELREVLQTLSVMALLDVASLAFAKQDFSRLEWLLLWGLVLFLLPLCRALTKLALDKMGCWQVPCVIIGCGDNALDAYQAIASEKLMGMHIQAFVAPDDLASTSPVQNVPLIRVQDYWQYCVNKAKVYVALEEGQRDLRDNWIRRLSTRGVNNISVIPSLRGVPLYGTDMSHFFSHEVMILRLRNNLARISSKMVKRAFDIVVSSILLILFSPLFVYLTCKIRRDGGPATYGHERIGYRGRAFKCLKFRSMVINSQAVLAELLANDPQAQAEWDKDFKLKNDPRITSIGQFIRKTSLDELPQLWNVFKGEMSLVGPRPIVEEELKRYHDDVEYYLMVKPGMTGLWQVSGRNDTSYANRIYFDSWYVKNWSLWYDIAILFKTAKVVIAKDGAY